MGETLTWIIDRGRFQGDEAAGYVKNRALVHSLGLKCDSVGWSKLDLGSPRTPQILDTLNVYCVEQDCRLRGYYRRTLEKPDPAWYLLRIRNSSLDYVASEHAIHAWRLPAAGHVYEDPDRRSIALVSDRFRSVILKAGFTGADFLWKQDVGKFRSRQYYSMFLTDPLSSFYSGNHLSGRRSRDKDRMVQMGGTLPLLTSLFHDLIIDVPLCIRTGDLPATEITGFHYDSSSYAQSGILFRSHVADHLLVQRLIGSGDLVPIWIAEAAPDYYDCFAGETGGMITEEDRETNKRAYEQFLSVVHPERVCSEKTALRILRQLKQNAPQDFAEALPRAALSKLVGSGYEPLIPWYRIANGFVLSDEYRLLPLDESIQETAEYSREIALEELTESIPGIVIGACPDGDRILLTGQNQILRISHENLQAERSWSDLPSFIVDAAD